LESGQFFTLQNNKRVLFYFWRAMHFSAKRGIANACRLSPSVYRLTLVDQDHILETNCTDS